jgi:hypothetical protein
VKTPCKNERAHVKASAYKLYNWSVSLTEGQRGAKFPKRMMLRGGREAGTLTEYDQIIFFPSGAGRACAQSVSAMKRARDYLVRRGWWEEIREPSDGETGAGIYRVVRHDEWVKMHGHKALDECRRAGMCNWSLIEAPPKAA